MKVALVLERFDVLRSDSERSTSELAGCLCALGLDVTIVAGQICGDDDWPFALVEVPFTDAGRASQWKKWEKGLQEYFAKNPHDIIHSMVPLDFADVYQPRESSLLHRRRREVVSYGKGLAAKLKSLSGRLDRGRRIRIERERYWCRSANESILVASSNYVGDQFVSLYDLDRQRLRLIRDGVNVENFRNEQVCEQGRNLRALYDRNGKTSLFLFVAEDLRLKGLDWLVQTSRQLEQRIDFGRNFRILVVSGADWSGHWAQVNRFELNKQILFMGPTRQVPALIQMADAVVLPTYDDACSRIVLEALAAGTPAITTRYNGAAKFLRNNKYGFVMDCCGDTYALAQALWRLCDKEFQRKLADHIEQDRLYEEVSMMRHGRELLQLYQQLKPTR